MIRDTIAMSELNDGSINQRKRAERLVTGFHWLVQRNAGPNVRSIATTGGQLNKKRSHEQKKTLATVDNAEEESVIVVRALRSFS